MDYTALRQQSVRLDEQIRADEARVIARREAASKTETHYAGPYGSHACETHRERKGFGSWRKMSAAAVEKALRGWVGSVREGVLCDDCAEPLIGHLIPKGL